MKENLALGQMFLGCVSNSGALDLKDVCRGVPLDHHGFPSSTTYRFVRSSRSGNPEGGLADAALFDARCSSTRVGSATSKMSFSLDLGSHW